MQDDMPNEIRNDNELEDKLQQLCLMYRTMRSMTVQCQSGKMEPKTWTITGGPIIRKIAELYGDLEEYTGAFDLRRVWDDLNERFQGPQANRDGVDRSL